MFKTLTLPNLYYCVQEALQSLYCFQIFSQQRGTSGHNQNISINEKTLGYFNAMC
jgi:hypothetical protein